MADGSDLTLDIFLRISAIALFAALGILIFRDAKLKLHAYLGAWSAASGMTYLMCTSPALIGFFGPLMLVIPLFCISGQLGVWLFSLSQFQDEFKIRAWHITVCILYLIFNRIYQELYWQEEGFLAQTFALMSGLFRFGLIGHMLFVAWDGRRDDLVEARRTFRVHYIVLVAAMSVGITVSETFFQSNAHDPALMLSLSAFMLFLAGTLLLRALNMRAGILFDGSERRLADKANVQDPTERHDIETIEKLIDQGALYQQAGLTIAGLADAANLPEHRLRRLINKHLGYRNFADFLNHYRINAAKERLTNVENRNMPVLTIAMDLGYGSLGPFNRAFKERTGLTPTEFRKKKLADS